MNLLTKVNFTTEVTDYETFLDQLLIKKPDAYDIYFFDNIFTFKYGKFLENLNKLIPSEQINIYKYGVASKTCNYDGNWVALVLY